MMNNSPEEDPKLLNFLRQHRSIAPAASPNAEDLLMSSLEELPAPHSLDRRQWQRYFLAGIGLVITGIVGIVTYQFTNPPQPSMAELQQLNRFLEAHTHDYIERPLDVDTDLFSDEDGDGES